MSHSLFLSFLCITVSTLSFVLLVCLVLRVMPMNDPHRPLVERLYAQISMLTERESAGFILFMQQMQQNKGASTREIEELPTYPYRKPQVEAAPGDDTEKERIT